MTNADPLAIQQSQLRQAPDGSLGRSLEGIAAPKPEDVLATIELRKKFRVLVVEDHPFVREGIRALLSHEEDLECCGEADSIAGAQVMIELKKPDLVLLDLRLKDGDAFPLIESLRERFPEVPVLVLSQFGELSHIEKALQAGARGYVMKQEASNQVIRAMRAVLNGQLYLAPETADPLLHKLLNQ